MPFAFCVSLFVPLHFAKLPKSVCLSLWITVICLLFAPPGAKVIQVELLAITQPLRTKLRENESHQWMITERTIIGFDKYEIALNLVELHVLLVLLVLLIALSVGLILSYFRPSFINPTRLLSFKILVSCTNTHFFVWLLSFAEKTGRM